MPHMPLMIKLLSIRAPFQPAAIGSPLIGATRNQPVQAAAKPGAKPATRSFGPRGRRAAISEKASPQAPPQKAALSTRGMPQGGTGCHE